MVKRLALLAAVAGLLGALVLTAYGNGDASGRVARSLDAMEHLRGVRFSLEATSIATGSAALAGPLALAYKATGELEPPDTLRLVVTAPAPATLYLSGRTALLNGQPASSSALRTLASPIAVLEQLRDPGTIRFSGLGLAGGTVSLRYAIDRGERGVLEVELGLFDGLIRRQTFTVTEAAPADGSGLATVLTRYVVEYWDHGTALGIKPTGGRGEPDRS